MNLRKHKNEEKEWHLIKKIDISYLQSNLLKKHGFEHAFFTKESGDISPKKLLKIMKCNSSVHTLNQVHGKKIITASISKEESPYHADGIVSDNKNQSLWVYTADCIPIFFAESEKGFVAAIHAGWKGIALNIIKETVLKLISLGWGRDNTLVALGPAISGKNYQVDIQVAQAIYNSFIEGSIEKVSDDYLKKELLYMKIIDCEEEALKVRLDIRSAALNQLIKSKINVSNISIDKHCTFSNYELFNSWRREQKKSLQWSFILSKD